MARRSLHDDVTAALRTLGVALPADALDAALSVAEKESLSHLEFLHRLLAGPAEARRQRALERRIRDAHFREATTLEGFDWAFNAKGLDRRAVEQLATCDFVRRRENVILVGQTGLGKSRILQSMGHAACVLGYRVRYATSAKLLQESTAALADGTFAQLLDAYARWDLLLIDEFGFDRWERAGSSSGQHVLLSSARRTLGTAVDCLGDQYRLQSVGRLPRRPAAGHCVSRPPGRWSGDPEAHRSFLPRPSRPACTGSRRYRSNLTRGRHDSRLDLGFSPSTA